jgi:16S rRNA (cytosine967-C5)-methyltransferase
MSAPRDYALSQLDRLALPGWRANLLRRKIDPPAEPRDLALAEQIRVGVIKNHLLLDYLTDHYATHPGRVDPLVRKIVSIALYQIRFLSRIPPSAAVDEAVEQTRRFGRARASGFVNALLRQALREPEVTPPEPSVALSHPRELFDRLVELLGADKAIEFCEHDNRAPPTIVRAFKGAPCPVGQADSVRITPHEAAGMFVVEGGKRATYADWAARGVAQVQDPTSARVVPHLDLRPGQDVLDRCAGMGTKTLQIHDELSGTGWIMAVDPAAQRIEALRELIQKRKIENIAVVQAAMLSQVRELKTAAFDRILMDAPCSNSGVLARRPEARFFQSTEHLKSLATLQDEILSDTEAYLRPGGILVYSTCSIWPEENEQRIEQFLRIKPAFELLTSQITWPSFDDDPTHYHDGGFFGVLRRN